MTDPNIANHTLEMLREIRDEQKRRFDAIDERTSAMQDTLHAVDLRLATIEQTTGSLLSMYGVQNERIVVLEDRVARIERRLELVD